jgi:hypothetical protein
MKPCWQRHGRRPMAKTCQTNGVTIAPPPIPVGSRITLTPVALHILLYCTVMFTWPNRQEPVSSIQPRDNQIVPAEEIRPLDSRVLS